MFGEKLINNSLFSFSMKNRNELIKQILFYLGIVMGVIALIILIYGIITSL